MRTTVTPLSLTRPHTRSAVEDGKAQPPSRGQAGSVAEAQPKVVCASTVGTAEQSGCAVEGQNINAQVVEHVLHLPGSPVAGAQVGGHLGHVHGGHGRSRAQCFLDPAATGLFMEGRQNCRRVQKAGGHLLSLRLVPPLGDERVNGALVVRSLATGKALQSLQCRVNGVYTQAVADHPDDYGAASAYPHCPAEPRGNHESACRVDHNAFRVRVVNLRHRGTLFGKWGNHYSC